MNNVIKDIKLILSNKKLLICLICFVITICAISGAYRYTNKSEENKGIRIGVANNDDSPYSDIIINFFKSNESFLELAQIVEDNETTIKSEFQSGNIDAYIIVPKDFSDSLMHLENTRIKIRINAEKEVEAIVLKAVLMSYENYVTCVQNNSVGLYNNLSRSGLTRKENLKINLVSTWDMINMALAKENYFDYKIIEQKKTSLVRHYIYTIILTLIIYYGIYVGVQIKKEQSKGVIELYTIGRGSRVSFFLSKIVVNATLIYIFLMMVISILGKMLKYKVTLDAYIVVLLNVLMYISLMNILAYIIKNKNVYIMITNGLALLTIIVGGGIIPQGYMPQNMQDIIKYLPINAFVEQMNNVLQ